MSFIDGFILNQTQYRRNSDSVIEIGGFYHIELLSNQ